MKYAMDLDGCVVDWDKGFRQVWNRQHPFKPIPARNLHWESPFQDTGLSHTKFWKWIDEEGVYWNLPPCENSVAVMKTLIRGHDVWYVTNRHPVSEEVTLQWLKSYDIEAPVLHTSDKWEVDADIYVDDNDGNLYRYVTAHPDKSVIRVIRPWNSHICGTLSIYSIAELLG